jgi:cytochrome bd-type quinol oxidase subunit 2
VLERLKRAAEGSILEAHPHYRTAIGVLGVAMSPILIAGWLLLAAKVESSISAYYHTQMRDWFVGTLWVIGVFLFFYQYRPRQAGLARSKRRSVRTGAADSWLGKIAGLCAVGVALVPTDAPPDSKDVPPTIGTLHGAAAAVLFICLALFPLLLFSQSRKRGRVYQGYGWAMIALLVVTAAYAFAPIGFKTSVAALRPILVLETLLITVFGLSWFERGRDLAAAPERDSRRTEEPGPSAQVA